MGQETDCTTRAVLSIRPQRLYNARAVAENFRTFWAEYQRLRSQTFEMKWR